MSDKSQAQTPTNSQTGRVSIKGLKHSAFASQETYCFETTIYIDGKKAGTASNSGCGGAHMYAPRELESALNLIASNLPPMDMSEFGGEPLTQTADLLISVLVGEAIDQKRIKSLIGKKLYLRRSNERYAKGEWVVLPVKTMPETIKKVLEKYGPGTIILGHNHHKLD